MAFSELRDFERRFDTMSVEELKRWQVYWTQYAQGFLAPKVRKLAMKRVHKIKKANERRSGNARVPLAPVAELGALGRIARTSAVDVSQWKV
jgi:hypothetical protein